jgi:hypothetical protein
MNHTIMGDPCIIRLNKEVSVLQQELSAARECITCKDEALVWAIDEAMTLRDNTDPLIDDILTPALAMTYKDSATEKGNNA